MIMAFSTHQVMNTDGGLATAAYGSGGGGGSGVAALLHGTHGVKPTRSETYIVWTHTSSKME